MSLMFFQVMIDKNNIVIGTGGGSTLMETGREDVKWVAPEKYPPNLEGEFANGKFMYDPYSFSVIVNPEYEIKTSEGYIYDIIKFEWVPVN